MTREIKFRGYNRKNNQWLYGFYLQNRGAHFVCPDEWATGKQWDDYQVEPETVGQFVGFADKNGKEIYEGDVVLWGKDSIKYIVSYTDGMFVAGLQDENLYGDLALWILCDEEEGDPCSIIGNIHDNPELLKPSV